MSEEKYILKFMGCNLGLTPSDFTFKVFLPANEKLIKRGYLLDRPYVVNGELLAEHFIARDKPTARFTNGLIREPPNGLLVCAWYDYAERAARQLIEAKIPVVHLISYGVRKLYFKEKKEEPPYAIWLSDNWKQSENNFVSTIASRIDSLRAS